jgi:hypothetical protein
MGMNRCQRYLLTFFSSILKPIWSTIWNNGIARLFTNILYIWYHLWSIDTDTMVSRWYSLVEFVSSLCNNCTDWLSYVTCFVIRKKYISSARTPLHCQLECQTPSIGGYPFVNPNLVGTMSPKVIWNDCESIYFDCPSQSSIITYNSFVNIYRIYNQSAATLYCGSYQNYYILYKNEFNSKYCSNSFDYINCIGK